MVTVLLVFSMLILPPEGGSHVKGEVEGGSHAKLDPRDGRHTNGLLAAPSFEFSWLPPSGGRATRQDDKSRGRKGDSATLTGCLNGLSLDATDAEEPEVQTALIGGLTFQLKGDKKLLKDLREQHDGKLVTVKGVLKSDLLQPEGQSKTVGRMRITIGGATPNPNSPHADTRRALPVLEVKSFAGTGATACR